MSTHLGSQPALSKPPPRPGALHENLPAGDRLLRPYFGMHHFEWSDDDSVEFHLPHGEMIALLRQSGLEVEELIEIRPPDRSVTRYPYVTLEWAQKWPCEEAWKARKSS